MSVTVSGGGNTVLTFNVSGSAATNYASDFSGALGAAPTVSNLSTTPESTVAGAFNYLEGSTTLNSLTLATPNQFTYIDVSTPFTVYGSSGGDTVAGGTDLTYEEQAGASFDKVIFTTGNNAFDGSSVSGGGDTIAGGTGFDTITTGAGQTTVFAGENSRIKLDDISPKGGDIAVLQEGNSTVFAYGASDTIFATTGLDASTTGTIVGGAGLLTFVTDGNASNLAVTIDGGAGGTDVFGSADLDLTFTGTGPASFVTGSGSETFTAGTGAESFFISTVAGGASISISDFTGSDSVNFEGSVTGTSTAGGNLTYTLSDGTKVEFVGITSLPHN